MTLTLFLSTVGPSELQLRGQGLTQAVLVAGQGAQHAAKQGRALRAAGELHIVGGGGAQPAQQGGGGQPVGGQGGGPQGAAGLPQGLTVRPVQLVGGGDDGGAAGQPGQQGPAPLPLLQTGGQIGAGEGQTDLVPLTTKRRISSPCSSSSSAEKRNRPRWPWLSRAEAMSPANSPQRKAR